MLKPHEIDQLQIEIVPAPNAIGRWSIEHEMESYGRTVGEDALERQRRLAHEARECTCGKQEVADKAAAENGEKPKKLLGHQHLPGCNSYRREAPKLIRAISAREQKTRYEHERQVDQLRDALARGRAEEEA